jgi:hypothetical protein
LGQRIGWFVAGIEGAGCAPLREIGA